MTEPTFTLQIKYSWNFSASVAIGSCFPICDSLKVLTAVGLFSKLGYAETSAYCRCRQRRKMYREEIITTSCWYACVLHFLGPSSHRHFSPTSAMRRLFALRPYIAPKPRPSSPPSSWSCDQCTYQNDPDATECVFVTLVARIGRMRVLWFVDATCARQRSRLKISCRRLFQRSVVVFGSGV